jgi:adenine-specific DNA-methyltransferase
MEDKIIEPTNAELLIKLIRNADDTTEALAIAELGTTYRKTGFHFDKRLEKMGSDIKYLKRNNTLSFMDGSDNRNSLIIGDNYDALLNLMITHKGMIDVIYIDPPYASDSMGKFADTNYANAITRDNLLSMLYPRLMLAKQLLSEQGVIFCSIDDRNQSYVKCLFDDIFNEQNFIGHYIKQSKVGGGSDSKFIVKEHEYCIVYAKNIEMAAEMFIPHDESYLKRYKEQDEHGRYFWDTFARPGLKNPIYYDIVAPDGTIMNYGWIHGKERFEQELKDGIVRIIPKKDGGWSVQFKQYLNNNGKKPRSMTMDFGGNIEGRNDLGALFANEKIFSYPKSVKFIKTLLGTISDKNITVLDFFAGSGTTGQAVLDLNREDGGNRKFILCTNNEITDTTPNGIAYDVTSKRLKRVMTGECYDGSSDFDWIKKNEALGGSLDVYEIETVNNAEQGNGKSPFDVIDETCYGLAKFTNPAEKITWVCANFEKTQKYLKED